MVVAAFQQAWCWREEDNDQVKVDELVQPIRVEVDGRCLGLITVRQWRCRHFGQRDLHVGVGFVRGSARRNLSWSCMVAAVIDRRRWQQLSSCSHAATSRLAEPG